MNMSTQDCFPAIPASQGTMKDIDTVVVQFVNTSGGHTWNITGIEYNKIIKILRKQAEQ